MLINYDNVDQLSQETLNKVIYNQELQWYRLIKDKKSEERLRETEGPNFDTPTFSEALKIAGKCYVAIKDKIEHNSDYIEIKNSATPLVNIEDPEHRIFYRNLSIIKIMNLCKTKGLWIEILEWSKLLDPKKLSNKPFSKKLNNGKNVTMSSDNEKWYLLTCKAYSKTEDHTKCKEVAQSAIRQNPESLQAVWFNYYVIKSKAYLDIANNDTQGINDGIDSFKSFLLKNKKEWFIYYEISTLYYALKQYEKSYYYLVKAINSNLNNKIEYKWELFYKASLVSKILNKNNKAKRYALLSYILREEQGWKIPQVLNDLIGSLSVDIDDNTTSKNLINDFKPYWDGIENSNLKLIPGTIKFYLPNGKAGFIETQDIGNIFFKSAQKQLPEGTTVTFNIEDTWDKSKDKESKIAVNIKVLNDNTKASLAA